MVRLSKVAEQSKGRDAVEIRRTIGTSLPVICRITMTSILGALIFHTAPAVAAPLSAREVTTVLFNAKPGSDVDFSGAILKDLDLANLDFKKANLARADLYGADLTRANLSNTDLSNARLDRATIIRADFSGADMANATILRPTTASTFSFDKIEAPRFNGTNLTGARIIAFIDGADFRGANLTDADFSPYERRGSQWATVPMTQMKYADFTGAMLTRANLKRAILHLTKFTNADLRGVNFQHADLSSADLSGADISAADFTDAVLDGVKLKGVKGRETAKGLSAH